MKITEMADHPNWPDRQCWSMLNGQRPEDRFKGWGAVEVFPTNDPISSCVTTYMLKTADGRWWYAHNNDTSCYVACGQSYAGKTVDQALAHRVLLHCVVNVASAEKSRAEAVAAWSEAVTHARELFGCQFDSSGNPIN